jgi:hypothetical protein
VTGCSSSNPAGPDPGDDAGPVRDATSLDATSDGAPTDRLGTDDSLGCLTCPTDAVDEAPPAVRVKGIIDQVCSSVDGCHGSGAGGMGLSVGHEFATLIGAESSENPPMLRVAPGDPDHSYVYLKLQCNAFGCMPPNGFEPTYAQVFHDWIEAGAPIP